MIVEILLAVLKDIGLGILFGFIMTIIVSLITGEFKTAKEVKNLFIGLSVANTLILFIKDIFDLF